MSSQRTLSTLDPHPPYLPTQRTQRTERSPHRSNQGDSKIQRSETNNITMVVGRSVLLVFCASSIFVIGMIITRANFESGGKSRRLNKLLRNVPTKYMEESSEESDSRDNGAASWQHNFYDFSSFTEEKVRSGVWSNIDRTQHLALLKRVLF